MKNIPTQLIIKTFIHTVFLVITGLILALLFPDIAVSLLLVYIAISFWFIRFFIYYMFKQTTKLIKQYDKYIQPEVKEAIETIINSHTLSYQSKYLSIIQSMLTYHAKSQSLSIESNVSELPSTNYDAINRVITDITAKSSNAMTYQEFYDLVLSEVVKIFTPVVRASFMIYNHETETIEFSATIGYDDIKTSNIHFMKHESLIYNAHNGFTSKPMIISNYHQRVEEQLSHKTYRSIASSIPKTITSRLSIPLFCNNEFYGVINIDQGNQLVIFDEFITIYEQLGTLISIVCENWELTQSSIQLSRYDKLTGLYNRSYFEQIFEKFSPKSLKKMMKYSLVLCDLNNLKKTNDNFGHIAGDKLLATFAMHLNDCVDTDDIIARLGGDEFIIIYKDKSKDDVHKIMQKLRIILQSNSIDFNGNTINIDFAYGVATAPDDSMIYDILFKIADENMYIDKANTKEKNRG